MNTFLAISLWIIAALMFSGTVKSISHVGRTPKPSTPSTVAITTVWSAMFITVLILSALAVSA